MKLEDIIQLIDKFDESFLTELKLEQDSVSLYLRRENREIIRSSTMSYSNQTEKKPQEQREISDSSQKDVELVTSPIVGTFYRAPSPDAPPFCAENDVVKEGSALCILEAMKMMNELDAEFTMKIVRFLVNNGDMVEYGTPLVEVQRV